MVIDVMMKINVGAVGSKNVKQREWLKRLSTELAWSQTSAPENALQELV